MEIFTSNCLENLLDVLAHEISSEKSTPESLFNKSKEVVVIQSLGMAKWLQQNLAEKNGIAANIEFPFLKNFILDILMKYGYSKKENIWDRETISWRIFKLLPEFEEKFDILGKYVGGEEKRRFQLAEKLGSLYDQYLVYRFDWLLHWSQGKKAPVKPGSTENLDSPHQQWQMELWQQLSSQTEESLQHSLMNFISQRDFSEKQLGLPEKISIFGVTNMPPVFIDFFEALSEVCTVSFFYLNPCAEYWGDMSMKKSLFERHDKYEMPHNDNYLLKSWGLLGRDFLNQLLERTEFNVDEIFSEPQGTSTLHEIQKSVLNMQERFYPMELLNDGSITINACHNQRRELEVLQNFLLKTLSENRSLEPRDIIVMAPDIQKYSPYIRNIFEGENSLPFSVSDQDISSSPLISTYKNILNLFRTRLTGNDILDIVEHPDVLRKFGLAADDVPQVREWIQNAAIRWGKDSEYRENLGLPAFEQNSWKFGFDRLLAGYAFSEEFLYEGSAVVPVEERGLILGRFKAAVDSLFEIQQKFHNKYPPAEWCSLLQQVLQDCFVEENENCDEHNFITQSISKLENHWCLANITDALPAEIVIKAFTELIDESSSSYGFLDNGITFCSLLPMRSIPAKVVCLLGIDEGAYPRSDRESGFDLISQFWRQGDRNRRLDDRYLFLESLLSAREKFYVSFRGLDENENSIVPPSIVLAEFLEYLEKSSSPIEIQYHPLHSFSPKYFDPKEGLVSYSQRDFNAAKSLLQENLKKEAFCKSDLDFAEGFDEEGIEISFNDLADFIKNPAKQFLKHQLGTSMWQEQHDELSNTEPFEKLDSLKSYKLRSQMTEKLLDHQTEIDSSQFHQKLKDYFLATGEFQLSAKGEENFEELFSDSQKLSRLLVDLQNGEEEETLEISLKYPEYGVTLTGKVERLFGNLYIPYHVGSDRFEHRFKYTLNFLAALSQKQLSLNYCVKGQESPFIPAGIIASDKAQLILGEMIEFYLQGMQRPLPFFASAVSVNGKTPQLSAIRKKWFYDSYNNKIPLCEDEAIVTCFGSDFPGDKAEIAQEIEDVHEFICSLYRKVWEASSE